MVFFQKTIIMVPLILSKYWRFPSCGTGHLSLSFSLSQQITNRKLKMKRERKGTFFPSG